MANFNGTSGDDTYTGTNKSEKLNGKEGSDTLNGSGGNDTLKGGQDNDYLLGGSGKDTYGFKGSYGDDVIHDLGGKDVIEIESAKKANISFFVGHVYPNLIFPFAPSVPSDSPSIVITDAKSGQTITVLYGADPSRTVEKLVLKDGKIDMTEGLVVSGTTADDKMFGTAGKDTVIGGGGDDTLDAGRGNDTYKFTGAHDDDRIDDAQGGKDKIWLPKLSASDVRLHFTEFDSALFIETTGGTIELTGHIDDGPTVEKIKLKKGSIDLTEGLLLEGTSADDNLGGTRFKDTVTGGEGDDTLDAGNGSDTYTFTGAFGDDVVTDSGGKKDRILLEGFERSDIRLFIDNSGPSAREDLFIFAGSGEIMLSRHFDVSDDEQVDRLKFDDGGFDLTEGLELAGDGEGNKVGGTAFADTITGSGGDDTIDGGGGNDVYLYGDLSGEDEITDAGGNADVIVFEDLLAEDVTLQAEGTGPSSRDDLEIIVDDSVVITLENHGSDDEIVEFIRFSDGTEIDIRDALLV